MYWLEPGKAGNLETVIIYAFIFAIVMAVFNAWLGLYHRTHSQTMAQTRARAVLSLYLSIPLAYCVFALLSIAEVDHKVLLLSGLAALFGTLAHRVYTVQGRAGAMMVRRVIIFGAGSAAKSVSKILKLLIPISRSSVFTLRAQRMSDLTRPADPAANAIAFGYRSCA